MQEEECSDCELIQKLANGNATINVTLKMNSNGRMQLEVPKQPETTPKSKGK
jgi:hypothetical protein